MGPYLERTLSTPALGSDGRPDDGGEMKVRYLIVFAF